MAKQSVLYFLIVVYILLLPTINSQIVLVEPAKYDIPEYNSQIQIVPGDGFSHFDGSSFKNNVWFFGKSEGNSWIIQMAG